MLTNRLMYTVLLLTIVISFGGYWNWSANSNTFETCDETLNIDEDIVNYDGHKFKISGGNAYTCDDGKWLFRESLIMDSLNYELKKTEEGCKAIDKVTGKETKYVSDFSDGFEAQSFRELFSESSWSHFALLSPASNSVKKYVALRKKIINGSSDFIDSRIDLVSDNVHSGKKSLRLHSVKPSGNVGKSLVEKENLCFGKGDDVWYSAWYFIEKGMPATIVDLETRKMKSGSGIRVFIRNSHAVVELKYANKPLYNQTKLKLPQNKWFNITLHLKLSNDDKGFIELWQDGEKILSTNGRTLPTSDTIYHAMQVGITAASEESILLIDDVMISNKRLIVHNEK